MPMGIVSDKDFESEKDKLNPSQREDSNVGVPTIPAVIKDIGRGRTEGAVEVPNSIRNLIGIESQTNGRQSALELASTLGISPSSVSAYSTGATSTSSYSDRPNSPVINSTKARIGKRARAKLMLALSHLTEDKLRECKPRDLAGIARDLSTVSRGMEETVDPANPLGKNNGPTFVFYSPNFIKEEKFETVIAKE